MLTEMEKSKTDATDAKSLQLRSMYLSRGKLKASSQTSALLAGFAMVALVELDLDKDVVGSLSPVWLYSYAIVTVLLVSVHLLALMMSTCILPHLDAVANTQCFEHSPHERVRWYIELAWFFSTVLGLLLFLVEIGILFWLKLRPLSIAAGYITIAMLIPVGIIFIFFTITFYRMLALHRYQISKTEIDMMYSQLARLETV